MSFTKIRIHLVFSTKNRIPWLAGGILRKVCEHIMQNCKEKDIYLHMVNGWDDHLHCLLTLGREQCISKIAQLIKGESSFWINKNRLCGEKFSWQDDYFAVSVSESQMEKVLNYIKNQKEHHKRKTSQEEADEFFKKYGWNTDRTHESG